MGWNWFAGNGDNKVRIDWTYTYHLRAPEAHPWKQLFSDARTRQNDRWRRNRRAVFNGSPSIYWPMYRADSVKLRALCAIALGMGSIIARLGNLLYTHDYIDRSGVWGFLLGSIFCVIVALVFFLKGLINTGHPLKIIKDLCILASRTVLYPYWRFRSWQEDRDMFPRISWARPMSSERYVAKEDILPENWVLCPGPGFRRKGRAMGQDSRTPFQGKKQDIENDDDTAGAMLTFRGVDGSAPWFRPLTMHPGEAVGPGTGRVGHAPVFTENSKLLIYLPNSVNRPGLPREPQEDFLSLQRTTVAQ